MNTMVNSNHISAYESANSGTQNSPGVHHRKPTRLKTVASKFETFDSLSLKSKEVSFLYFLFNV